MARHIYAIATMDTKGEEIAFVARQARLAGAQVVTVDVGTGGQAMEKLVASGLIDGVLDIPTTEVADEVVGGVFPAGPERFDAMLERRVPYVMSLGELDMVNYGALGTVPAAFRARKQYVHKAPRGSPSPPLPGGASWAAYAPTEMSSTCVMPRMLNPTPSCFSVALSSNRHSSFECSSTSSISSFESVRIFGQTMTKMFVFNVMLSTMFVFGRYIIPIATR